VAREIQAKGPLAAVKAVDLTDERAIYGAKLLADLGADTVRIEPEAGDPLRARGPHLESGPGAGESLWFAYSGSSRTTVHAEPGTDAGRVVVEKLCLEADVVLDNEKLKTYGLDAQQLIASRPSLVVVATTSFGADGPWSDYLAPELVASALGGLSATCGDADTPPLRPFSELTFSTSGCYAAVSALTGLRHARETGEGQVVDLSVHESVASCLEHVLMWAWYHDEMPRAVGPSLPRQGSVHWSTAYEVMKAKGGSILITPTPDLQKQIAWLVEEGAEQDLLDEKWADPANIADFIERYMQVLREWVATWDVEELFYEAQRRHHPFGWVMAADEVASCPQLVERDWWANYTSGGRKVKGPGAPYHFARTPWQATPNVDTGGSATSADNILTAVGWEG
jgi:crotonobetainyl-CoA:carnitine CoA-transferase CaiB-like acyl-CoA transferase